MYWAGWGSQLTVQPQQGMQHCPPSLRAQEAFCREAHEEPHLASLRRHKQNNDSISKEHLCNLFLQWLRVFLYAMQLCLLPFFCRWCLFLSVCVDIFCSMRPHNNALLLGACGRVACKGCTGCTLHYSRAIKSRTVSFYKKMPLYCYNIPQCHVALKSHATLFKGSIV